MLRLPEGIKRNPMLDKNNYPFVVNKETNKVLIGRWIGAVEIVMHAVQTEYGWDCDTEYFPAYQLETGRIVYVDDFNSEDIEEDIIEISISCDTIHEDGMITEDEHKVKVHVFDGHGLIRTKVQSLKNENFEIKWGLYPIDFKEEWKYCVSIPVPVKEGIFTPIETDELPF